MKIRTLDPFNTVSLSSGPHVTRAWTHVDVTPVTKPEIDRLVAAKQVEIADGEPDLTLEEEAEQKARDARTKKALADEELEEKGKADARKAAAAAEAKKKH